MKKITIITAIIVAFVLNTSAQKKIGLGFNVAPYLCSLTPNAGGYKGIDVTGPSLILKYQHSDSLIFRVKFIHNEGFTQKFYQNGYTNEDYNQTAFSVGFERLFYSIKGFNAYYGADLLGEITHGTLMKPNKEFSNYPAHKQESQIGIGARGFVGISYLFKFIEIGTELGYGTTYRIDSKSSFDLSGQHNLFKNNEMIGLTINLNVVFYFNLKKK